MDRIAADSERHRFFYFRRRARDNSWGIWPGGWFSHDRYETVVQVPYWSLVGLTAVLPIWWWALRRRRARRVRGGLCVRCGYDLRASPQKCPECGAAPSGPGAGSSAGGIATGSDGR